MRLQVLTVFFFEAVLTVKLKFILYDFITRMRWGLQ